MAVQVYSGFGYWNGLSWILSFVLALLIVLAVTGLGRRDFRSSASSAGSEEALSRGMTSPPLVLPRWFKGGDLPGALEERRGPDRFPDQTGAVVLFMALLLVAVLLGGGFR